MGLSIIIKKEDQTRAMARAQLGSWLASHWKRLRELQST